MYSWTRTRVAFAAGLALAVACLPAGVTRAQGGKKKGESKEVTFKTYDGVEIAGTFYPAKSKDKDAVVLLLHDFSPKKGGDSHQDNLDEFAEKLQAAGYAVLSFDFRGFGQSKSIEDSFLKYPQNRAAFRRPPKKAPESIDHKQFQPQYYRYLVNDIAAAKAYLDRKNDSREVNTSNLIVIGAGQGATLGALWMASQWHLYRDTNPPGVIARPKLGNPEGKDQACAVWLSISPRLGTMPVGGLVQKWVATVSGRTGKVPMGFLYSKEDTTDSNFSTSLYKHLKEGKGVSKLTAELGFKTKLIGTGLLNPRLDAADRIVKDYLPRVLEDRRTRERVTREISKHAYYYVIGGRTTVGKTAGDDSPQVPVNVFFPR